MQHSLVTDSSVALTSFTFPGPAGALEGLWKEGKPPLRGSAVFAHPHPLHGGTLHNKVVFRVARALVGSGFGTLRFNFRGAGVSLGRHDHGHGEKGDFRAALDETERRGGLPIVAGGFSFGAAVALRAVAGDPRVAAYVGVGLPLATESGEGLVRPQAPSLFVVGERDTFGPPPLVREFVRDGGQIVEIAGADHFFEGKLDLLEQAVASFLERLALPPRAP
jgi:alpha/beta superfamily hydrolase